jgi:hypothetical protein
MEGEPVENITFNVDTENTPVADVTSLENTIIPATEDTLVDTPPTEDTLVDTPPTEDTLVDTPPTEDTLVDTPPVYNDLKSVDSIFITPLVNNENVVEQTYTNQSYEEFLERLEQNKEFYNSYYENNNKNYSIIQKSQKEIDEVINTIQNFKKTKNHNKLQKMSIFDNHNNEEINNISFRQNAPFIKTSPYIFPNNITRKNTQMKMFFQ